MLWFPWCPEKVKRKCFKFFCVMIFCSIWFATVLLTPDCVGIQLGKFLEEGSCFVSSHVKLRHFSLLSLRSKVILHTSSIAKFGKHKLNFSVCQYCFTEVPGIVHRELSLLNKWFRNCDSATKKMFNLNL